MDPATAQMAGLVILESHRARAEPRKSGTLLSKIGRLAEETWENSYCGNNNQNSATMVQKQHQAAGRLGGGNKGSRLGPWESSPRHHYLFPTSHYAVARPPSRLCPPIRQTRRLQSPCAGLHRQSELLSHLFRAASLSDGAAVNQGSIRLLPGLAARRSPALSGSIAWTSAPRWPSSSSVAAAALLPVICL